MSSSSTQKNDSGCVAMVVLLCKREFESIINQKIIEVRRDDDINDKCKDEIVSVLTELLREKSEIKIDPNYFERVS